MNAAGYESFLCGKMHYDREHRYGFTEIGGNMNNNFMTGHGNRRAADDLGKPQPLSERFAEFHAGDESSIMRHDRAVTAGVLEFLSKRNRGDKPFYLQAGYLAPHFPLIVPQAYWEAYRGRVPMPVIPPGHLESLPLNYKHLRAGFHGKRPGRHRAQGTRTVSRPGAMVRQPGRQGARRLAGQRAVGQHRRDLHGRPR